MPSGLQTIRKEPIYKYNTLPPFSSSVSHCALQHQTNIFLIRKTVGFMQASQGLSIAAAVLHHLLLNTSLLCHLLSCFQLQTKISICPETEISQQMYCTVIFLEIFSGIMISIFYSVFRFNVIQIFNPI